MTGAAILADHLRTMSLGDVTEAMVAENDLLRAELRARQPEPGIEPRELTNGVDTIDDYLLAIEKSKTPRKE